MSKRGTFSPGKSEMTDLPSTGISPSSERGDSVDKQGITCIIWWILGLLIAISLVAVSLAYLSRYLSSLLRSTAQERGPATELTTVNATTNQILRATSSPAGRDVIFRDDFVEVLADGWTWDNEDKSAWRITYDDQLQIVSGDATLLATENGQSNVLLRDSPMGNFEIVASVSVHPSVDFQQAAIFIYQDDDNFVAINRGFCSPCVGDAVYLDNEVDGDPWSSQGIWFPTDATELYLRLVREKDTYTALFSLDGETWVEVGFVQRVLLPSKVGLSATNADVTEQDDVLVAKFDYFVIREVR